MLQKPTISLQSKLRIEKILFCLLIFLIPSNLSLHLFERTAVVDGILVDYLIPKFYLTDIFIITLLIISLVKSKPRLRSAIQKSSISYYLLAISFFVYIAATIPFSVNPVAAIWFWLKLLELALFIWYLRQQKLNTIYKILYTALPLTVIFQSTFSLLQWIKQSSVTPYWLLGESQFSALTPGIAKASFFGFLKVLPMGTTPHPNVLAGFMAVSLIVVSNLRYLGNLRASPEVRQTKKSVFANASYYITLIFGLFTLFLTQSLTAIAVLALGWILLTTISHFSISSKHRQRLPTMLIILATSLLIVWGLRNQKNILESTSLSRRAKLNNIAVEMIKNRPFFGVGLNNFTAVMKDYGEVESTTRFLQPVHNIYLLLLSETGLIGFGLVTLVFWKLFQKTKFSIFPSKKRIGNCRFSTPVLMLLVIGVTDHYPFTLQQGQLMLALSLGLASMNSKHK